MAPTLKTASAVRVRPGRTAGETMAQPAWAPAEHRALGVLRRGERRRGVAGVCQSLAASLMREQGDGLRGRFIDGIRRVVPAAASITLRDWRVGETPVAAAPERRLLSVDVPTADPRIVAALDAVPLDARQFDEWDLQVLTLAGRLAGVLLEVEALRRTQRANALRAFPGRPDGAAPLIGSTPVMRALRDRIERLAATDFTVLIEGGIDPEAHPSLAVRGPTIGEWENGKVEGMGQRASRLRLRWVKCSANGQAVRTATRRLREEAGEGSILALAKLGVQLVDPTLDRTSGVWARSLGRQVEELFVKVKDRSLADDAHWL